MSIDKLIKEQNTEFYELGKKHGYDEGFEAGILQAVKILRSATLAGDVEAAQDPYPAGEATFEIPGNDEATFDEKEAYYASLDVIGSEDAEPAEPLESVESVDGPTEPEDYENIFAPRKSPIKHAKHHDFWKDHGISFAVELEAGTMTVSEAVEGAKKFGITYKSIKSKAARFGYGIKKNKFYKRS